MLIATGCACEHEAHFDRPGAIGTAEHAYGHGPSVVASATEYGMFRICEACYDAGHMRRLQS